MVHTIDPDDPLSNNNIEQKLKICIIDLVDPGSEERIKEILQAELRRGKIKLPFEKIEVFKGRKMFT